jgi:uncharacterized coiled-coil DUF342 family protein
MVIDKNSAGSSILNIDTLTKQAVVDQLLAKHENLLNSYREELVELEMKEVEARRRITEALAARDKLNFQVAELKRKRSEQFKLLKELRTTFFDLANKEKKLRDASEKLAALKDELENLDWKIQTTAVTLDAEREIMDRIKRCYSQLDEYQMKDKLRTDMESKITNLSSEIGKLFRETQATHESMLTYVEEASKYHQEWLDANRYYMDINKRVKELRRKIAEHTKAIEYWQQTRGTLTKGDV